MKITNDMINKEIRIKGLAFRALTPNNILSSSKLINKTIMFLKGKHSDHLKYEQVYIPRDPDNKVKGEIRLCIYRPLEQKENAPGVLWIHGGGYALGVPEQEELFIQKFVLNFGCTVISPDYCLSVEKPYPQALEDCYSSLLWMRDHADEYKIKSNQLFIGGESAGGGLTAALAIYARDKKEVSIAFQMPLYPMIDDRMITSSSKNNNAPVWNTKSNAAAWKLYLGPLYNSNDVPAYAAPSRLKDFTNLPPAITYVGNIEPFYDETINYMENLNRAGVPINYKIFKGCYHGFDIISRKSNPSKEAHDFLIDNFDYAVKHYFALQP